MQQNSMAEKKIVKWDGSEIPGLISVDEIKLEKAMIDAPSFKKIRKIQSDITTIPAVNMKYKTDRNTNTLQFWEDFYNNNEVKDGVIVRTDASGAEFHRQLLPGCECVDITYPAYDAANPSLATISVVVLPYDIISLKAE